MRKWALLMMLCSGCAEVPPVSAKVDVATMRLSKEQSLGNEKVGIALDLVTPDTLAEHPELRVNARWHEKNDAQVYTGSMTGVQNMKTVSAKLPILPLPAFVVRIINRSDAPISFGRARFELKDDLGKVWKTYKDAGDITGRLETDLISTHPNATNDSSLVETMRDLVSKVPLLDRTIRVAPHADWQGYLVFELSAHDLQELHAYLAGVKSLTLTVTDVDGTEPLVANLVRTQVQLTMTCQGDKPPSVKTCKLPE